MVHLYDILVRGLVMSTKRAPHPSLAGARSLCLYANIAGPSSSLGLFGDGLIGIVHSRIDTLHNDVGLW
jgi:hypothetical protein